MTKNTLENPSGWDITKFTSDLYQRLIKEESPHKWYFNRFEAFDTTQNDAIKEFLWVSLVYFISKGWEDDIINDILGYSIQSGYQKWFDLNAKFYHYNASLFVLPETVIRWNYQLFQKLLDLKVNFLQFGSLDSLNIWSNKETWSMLEDLLDLGFPVNKQDILSAIERRDADSLRIIYEYELKHWEWDSFFTLEFLQNLLNPNFEEESYSQVRYTLEHDKDGSTKNFLTQLYYKLQLESKVSQKDSEKEVVDTSVEIIWEELEAEIRKKIWAPEFVADIVIKILAEEWVVLEEQVVKWLKEKIRERAVARSDEIVSVLVGTEDK